MREEHKTLGEGGRFDPGTVRDTQLGTPLSVIREKWKRYIERSREPFVQFYIACPDDQLDAFVGYLTETMGKGEASLLHITIEPSQSPGIHQKLKDLEGQIAQHPSSTIAVVVHGFETLISQLSESERPFAAHNLNQEIAETDRREHSIRVPEGKKVLLLLHIGYSLGDDVARNAIMSAIRSQFKAGIVLIGAPH